MASAPFIGKVDEQWRVTGDPAAGPPWAEARAEPRAAVETRVARVRLAAGQVCRLRSMPFELCRPARMVEQSTSPHRQLWLTVQGSVRVVQGSREAAAGAADFVLFDSSRPFRILASAPRPPVEIVQLSFPSALSALLPGGEAPRDPVEFSGRTTPGALLAELLCWVCPFGDGRSDAELARLGMVPIDLLAAALAGRSSIDRPAVAAVSRLTQVLHFIDQHLGDAALSPRSIAAQHHLSLRQLHQVFHDDGMSVAGWIRARRLQRCRQDLADPLLRDSSIAAIAARWGFANGAHFSRAFRAAFQEAPSHWRQRTGC